MAPKGGPCHCKCGGKYHGMDSTVVYDRISKKRSPYGDFSKHEEEREEKRKKEWYEKGLNQDWDVNKFDERMKFYEEEIKHYEQSEKIFEAELEIADDPDDKEQIRAALKNTDNAISIYKKKLKDEKEEAEDRVDYHPERD